MAVALLAGTSAEVAAGAAPTAVPGAPIAPAELGEPSTFVSVSPARIVDTRSARGGIAGPIASETTVDFQVIGMGNVPEGATSVVLNVTAVDPEALGYFTVFPTGVPRPEASNLNFVAGKTVANLVIARIGSDGKVSLYNFGGRAHVIFDVTGYFTWGTGAARFHGTLPTRYMDTRIMTRGIGAPAPVGAGQVLTAVIGNTPPAQSHMLAVLVNVTATRTSANGYLSVFPAGETLPPSSNLNFKAGQTVANAVIVKLGTTSSGLPAINIFNAFGTTDVIVDVMGIFDDGHLPLNFTNPTAYRALDQPVRVYNTRLADGPFGPRETRIIDVARAGGAPAGALGVVFNATATATTAGSFLTIWPPHLSQPTVSSLNWGPDETVPNFVGVSIASTGGTPGQLSVYNDAGFADVLIDVTGYFYRLP